MTLLDTVHYCSELLVTIPVHCSVYHTTVFGFVGYRQDFSRQLLFCLVYCTYQEGKYCHGTVQCTAVLSQESLTDCTVQCTVPFQVTGKSRKESPKKKKKPFNAILRQGWWRWGEWRETETSSSSFCARALSIHVHPTPCFFILHYNLENRSR